MFVNMHVCMNANMHNKKSPTSQRKRGWRKWKGRRSFFENESTLLL